MFIDASALTAMLVDEDDARELLGHLQATSTRQTSPLAVWETAIAVARVLDLSIGEASAAVERFIALVEILVMPIAPETTAIALSAFERYGKGRHPARLNFGDCFAYACARHLDQPLMFKGGDFLQTDIEAA